MTPEQRSNCVECQKPIEDYAGNPSFWGTFIADKARPGKMLKYHVGCLTEKVFELTAQDTLWKARMGELHSKLKTAVEGLEEYGEHDKECLLAQCHAGRPTADGGYEHLYGYGEDEKWYQSRPVDKTPKCQCGFSDVITQLKEGEDGIVNPNSRGEAK